MMAIASAVYNASAKNRNEKLVVKAGSILSGNKVKGFISNKQSMLLRYGYIIPSNGKYKVIKDFTCSVSGGAALVLGGHPGSGFFQWIETASGNKLDLLRLNSNLKVEIN
ncbi:hypothetical protein ABER68_04195 [Paenibacillus alvei]